MSLPNHSGPPPSNGTGGAKHLLDFVRDAREILLLAAGSVLFREGDPCRGAYFVEVGELLLTITAGERHLPVGSAHAGHLLGISSVVSGSDYQCTAEAARESKVTFVPAPEMRQYLQEHAEVCLFAAERLGAELLDLSDKAIRPLRLQPRYPK